MDHLTSNQFDNLLSLGQKALVMFYADWCPYCQGFKPLFENLETVTSAKGYKIYASKINEDENPLWERFSITAVPTVIAFEKGKIIARRDAKMGMGLTKLDVDSLIKEMY